MENQKTFREIFDEALAARGISLEKLAEAADVPAAHLTAIYEEDGKRLPPAPYVRGYLMKAAEILGTDGNILWQAYKKNLEIRTSGENDRLPFNRFAFKKIKKGKYAIAVLGAFVIIYLIFNIGKFFGGSIDVYSPAANSLVVNSPTVDLKGKIDARSSLTINNEAILVDSAGNFEKQYSLQPGINIIEFKAKKLLGKEVRVIKEVIYQH